MINEVESYNDVNHPQLCPHLRWKGRFIGVEHDANVPSMSSGNFWCVYTHNCLGPDRELAAPANCSSPDRVCHGSGKAE